MPSSSLMSIGGKCSIGSANSESLAYGLSIGSATELYKCMELEVSPNAMHWFDGEISKLIMLQPNWNIDICGVERAAVSTNCTCPRLDITTMRDDIDCKNLS